MPPEPATVYEAREKVAGRFSATGFVLLFVFSGVGTARLQDDPRIFTGETDARARGCPAPFDRPRGKRRRIFGGVLVNLAFRQSF